MSKSIQIKYSFKQMLKRHVFNKGFLYGIIILLVCYFSISIYEWKSALNEPVLEYRPNALMLSVEAIFFGGIMLVLPFCTCLPTAVAKAPTNKIDDIKMRKRYIRNNVLCSFISGALCAILPFIVHAVVWNIIAMPADPVKYESHMIIFSGLYAGWYNTLYAFPMYLSISIGMAFSGGVLAVMYLAVSEKTANRLNALVLPACIYFIWLKVSNFLKLEWFPSPDTLFNDALTVNKIIYTGIMYSIVFIISVAIYLKSVIKRCILNEKCT